jgi:hypothetical protein
MGNPHEDLLMTRLDLWLIVALVALAGAETLSAQQPPVEQPAEQPPAVQPPAVQPQDESPPVELIEAARQEIWTLGELQWDFRDIATAYVPVKGLLNPQTGVVEWTLEIVREMSDGEVGLHENLDGTPFRPMFLDAERIALEEDAPVRMTRITGKVGDRVKMTLRLPEGVDPGSVRFVRIGRRTKVGF